MASLQILKSSLFPFFRCDSDFTPKPTWFCLESASGVSRDRIQRLAICSNSKNLRGKGLRVRCGPQEGDNRKNGEEPPESLFMKELRRRGMNPTSLLEDSTRSFSEIEELKLNEDERGSLKRNVVSTEIEKGIANQRERSMALNSEGLEGLIPRAKILLTLGGTFFFGFWPFILVTVAFFFALYLYFGPAFIHDGSNSSLAHSQYIDPYALLEDERMSKTAPGIH